MGQVKLPEWLPSLVVPLMEAAEAALPGRAGAAKKAWVKKTAKDLIDVKGVPDAIEDAAIDIVIEVLWAAAFRKGA